MLVGAPMGGKTAIATTLAGALTKVERQNMLTEETKEDMSTS
jgi:protein-L-isoaspartate O-methyltransferase